MKLSMLSWVQKAFEFLATQFLKKQFPAYAKLFDNVDQVLSFALEVIDAAEATGADGATKKAAASKDLLAKLTAAGFDIPGDQDQIICDLIIEVVVGAVKRFFHLS